MKVKTLHALAQCNLVRELESMLAAGADPNEKNEFGATALQCAIAEKHDDAAVMLLEHGADVCAQDREGSTSLHWAIEHGRIRLAEVLLQKDPRVVSVEDNYGNQPLWTAVFNARGNYQWVSLLLRYGADPLHRNRVNRSPLDMARRMGDETLVGILEAPR